MTGQTLLFASLALGLGALWTFAGYRFFILLLAVGGFLAGFGLGSTLAPTLLPGASETAGWVVGGIVGILIALLARHLFQLGVTLLAGLLAAWATAAAAAAFGVEPALIPVVAAVGGIVGAMAAAILQAPKWLVVGLTSMTGAGSIVAGVLVLTGRVQPSDFLVGAERLRLGPESFLLGVDGLRAAITRALTAPAEVLLAEPIAQVAIVALAVLGVFIQARGLGLLGRRRMVLRSA